MNDNVKKFRERGMSDAKDSLGNADILKIHLKNILKFRANGTTNHNQEQEEKIKSLDSEVSRLNSTNEEVKNSISEREKLIETIESKQSKNEEKEKKRVDSVKQEIKHKEQALSEVSKKLNTPIKEKIEKGNLIAYRIGVAILVGVTIFLFIFYSSACYSAYIRDTQAELFSKYRDNTALGSDDETIGSEGISIINLDAVNQVLSQGSTSEKLIGILFLFVVPFLLLTPGYLIYQYKDKRSIVILAYVAVFLFDVFIVYHIVKEVHVAKHMIGAEPLAWNDLMIFSKVTFYMLLMTGFGGYFMWGLLFERLMSVNDKLHPIQKELNARKKTLENDLIKLNEKRNSIEGKALEENRKLNSQASNLLNEITALREKISKNEKQAIDTNSEKSKINSQKSIDIDLLEQEINDYVIGWMNYISQNYKDDPETRKSIISKCVELREKFINEVNQSSDYFKSNG